MIKTKLRTEGGSTVVTIPKAVLSRLEATVGGEVEVVPTARGIELRPIRTRPQYTLDELLAQCDFSIAPSDEEREWLDMPDAGNERIP